MAAVVVEPLAAVAVVGRGAHRGAPSGRHNLGRLSCNRCVINAHGSHELCQLSCAAIGGGWPIYRGVHGCGSVHRGFGGGAVAGRICLLISHAQVPVSRAGAAQREGGRGAKGSATGQWVRAVGGKGGWEGARAKPVAAGARGRKLRAARQARRLGKRSKQPASSRTCWHCWAWRCGPVGWAWAGLHGGQPWWGLGRRRQCCRPGPAGGSSPPTHPSRPRCSKGYRGRATVSGARVGVAGSCWQAARGATGRVVDGSQQSGGAGGGGLQPRQPGRLDCRQALLQCVQCSGFH